MYKVHRIDKVKLGRNYRKPKNALYKNISVTIFGEVIGAHHKFIKTVNFSTSLSSLLGSPKMCLPRHFNRSAAKAESFAKVRIILSRTACVPIG